MALCALVIGHTPDAPGAANKSATEFDFNEELAHAIDASVKSVDVKVVYRDRPDDLVGLPAKVNTLNPDFIVELHANAFNKDVSGTEVLYWHASEKGKEAARILQNHLLIALGLPDRGIKGRKVGERGSHLLRYTKAPCLIAEPFFIDHDYDYEIASWRHIEIIRAYAIAIEEIATYVI